MGRNSQRRRAAKLRKQQDRRRLDGAPVGRNPNPNAPDAPSPQREAADLVPGRASERSPSPAPVAAPVSAGSGADRRIARIDQDLAVLAARTLRLGWSAADLVHLIARGSARRGRLMARIVTTDDHGADVVASPPFFEPWCSTEQLDHLEAMRDVAVIALVLKRQYAVPPRRRSASAKARPSTDVLTKVRALLAKAEGTSFPAEAEAFTAKAQELMSRYAIDEAMLAASADLRGAAAEMSVGRVHLEDPYLTQKAHLLNVVARANGARAVLHQQHGMATIVGSAHDLDMVELLFTSLLLQATVAMQDAGRGGAHDRTRGFRAAFLEAFAVRIGERLREANEVAVADGERTYGSALVPVLAAKEQRIDAALEEMFEGLQRRRSARSVDARGWHAGRAAADRADVGAHGRLAG